MKLPLTLYECKIVIIRWIHSCETAEQVDLLIPYIKEYLLPRFERELKDSKLDKKVLAHELKETISDLFAIIKARKYLLRHF